MLIQKIEAGMRTCEKCRTPHMDPKMPHEGRKLCNACSPVGHVTPEMAHTLIPFMRHRNMNWKQLYAQLRRYGMSYTTLVQYVKKQGLNCGMCDELIVGAFNIDHDHGCCPKVPTCGKCNRGLICSRCNILLAGYDFYKENPKIIDNYIASYRKQRKNFSSR